jgi:hypothetical protein
MFEGGSLVLGLRFLASALGQSNDLNPKTKAKELKVVPYFEHLLCESLRSSATRRLLLYSTFTAEVAEERRDSQS